MVLTDSKSDRLVINAIKTSLQSNLTDPRQQYEPISRSWVHTDKPLDTAKYPRIQIRKAVPTQTQIISMGEEFVEWRALVLDIQFWTKSPFKWTNASSVVLKDEELVKEYLNTIGTTLKGQQDELKVSNGLTGYKILDEGEPFLEDNSQVWTGVIRVRWWYFRK